MVDFTLCITLLDFYNPHNGLIPTLHSNFVWSSFNLGFLHNLPY